LRRAILNQTGNFFLWKFRKHFLVEKTWFDAWFDI
jgi:hypothetical protein